jgi:nickel transport protein
VFRAVGKRFPKCCPVILGILLLSPSPAWAHKLNLFAHVEGATIQGKAYFSGGTAAQGVKVVAFDPAGKELGQTTTDTEGKFTMKPGGRCDHRLVVRTDDGHAAEFTVPAAELPEGDAVRANDNIDALTQQVVRLREDLNEYEQRLRFRDVLGGIGYIVGVSGVAFYFLGARRNRHG